jgi:hypothetical protein
LVQASERMRTRANAEPCQFLPRTQTRSRLSASASSSLPRASVHTCPRSVGMEPARAEVHRHLNLLANPRARHRDIARLSTGRVRAGSRASRSSDLRDLQRDQVCAPPGASRLRASRRSDIEERQKIRRRVGHFKPSRLGQRKPSLRPKRPPPQYRPPTAPTS